jgi:catechol 2,3-dioxygenase-like lactoylglutathione lyase family enzyme
MTTVSVRYITDDVDAAVDFYAERLGFNVEMRPGTGFAMLSRGDLRLLLNRPGAGGAGQPMPDGRRPQPGGGNRIVEVNRCVDVVGDVANADRGHFPLPSFRIG